jgi:hypothetical protein
VCAVYTCALLSLLLGRHTSCAAGVAFLCCVSQQVCSTRVVLVVHFRLGYEGPSIAEPCSVRYPSEPCSAWYPIHSYSTQVCAPSESSGMYSVAAHALFWAALMPMQACNHNSYLTLTLAL